MIGSRTALILVLGHLPGGRVEFRVHHHGTGSFVVKRDLGTGSSAEFVLSAPD